MRTRSRGEIVFLGLLIAVAAALRIYRIETGLWFDEIATLLDSVRQPLAQIVMHFPSNNDHPLYSVFARLSIVSFGDAPWALRLPAALFGVATIPLLYLLGTAVTTRLEAGAAALMMMVSYHHVWFSQNARGYTMLLFSAMLATLALIRWLDTGRRSFLAVYAITTALGAYSHLTMVFVCVTHACVCGAEGFARTSASRAFTAWKDLLGAFIGAAILTVALYAPMLADVGAFFTTDNNADTAATVATPGWAVLAALRGLQTGFNQLWAIGLGSLVFAGGVWSYFRQRSAVALLFLLPVPVTLLVMAAMSRPIRPRFVFFAIGFGLLIIVRGSAWIGARLASFSKERISARRGATVLVVLATTAFVTLSIRSLPYGYRFPKQDYEQAVLFVEQHKGNSVAAAIGETSAVPILRYLNRPWQRVDNASQLRALRATATETWVVYTLSDYIKADQPDLWTALQAECTDIREFHGTVEGGTINVRRCP